MSDESLARLQLLLECVRCRAALNPHGRAMYCVRCETLYPTLGNVPVLVPAPRAFIADQLAQLTRAAAEAQMRSQSLAAQREAESVTTDDQIRLEGVYRAEQSRTDLFLTMLSEAIREGGPVSDARENESVDADEIPAGWALPALVPFLVRDWVPNDEFAAAAELILPALRALFPDPSEAIITFSGCGAAGLAGLAAAEFGLTIGTDLSLATLIAARKLCDGETIDLDVAGAGGVCAIALGGPHAVERAPVILTAMDAVDTAFGDGVLDCVVTAFLLDLFPDPTALVREIHRTLKPNGVWINYGPTGPLDATHHFSPSELSGLVTPLGFETTSVSSHRTTFLDLTDAAPAAWSHYQSHVCHMTSMRKSATPAAAALVTGAALPENLTDGVPAHHRNACVVTYAFQGPPAWTANVLQFETLGRQTCRYELGPFSSRVLPYVDGHSSLLQVARRFADGNPDVELGTVVKALHRYVQRGLLTWRRPTAAADPDRPRRNETPPIPQEPSRTL